MYIQEELRKITERISTDEFLNTIIETYLEELKGDEWGDNRQEYEESKKILETILSEEQKKDLLTIENLYTENMKYSLKFGFQRGIYAGFEQFFVTESTKEFFSQCVYDDLLTIPHMKKHTDYYKRRVEIHKLFDKVMEGLGSIYQEHVTTIECTYDERNYGVLRYAFYIGYRYALDLIEGMNPTGIVEITDKILYTEHCLGFTMTYREREKKEYRKQTVVKTEKGN